MSDPTPPVTGWTTERPAVPPAPLPPIVGAPPAGPPSEGPAPIEETPGASRRRRGRLVAAGLLAVALVAGAAVVLTRDDGGPTPRDPAAGTSTSTTTAGAPDAGPTDTGSTNTTAPSAATIETQVQQLTAFYQQNLGLDAAKSECIARTVIGWQVGATAVPDGAQKPLTDALAACGIDPSEVHAPAG